MTDKIAEETVSTKRIYEGRVINMRVDTVRLPNGKTSTREIIEHRGAVAVVPILGLDTVVMVRQYRAAAGGPLLEIPAGTREPDEDITLCASRELAEEINFHPGRIFKLFESFMAPGYTSELIHTFLALDLTQTAGNTDEDEFVEVVHVPLEEAVDMIGRQEIRDAKSIAGLLYVSRFLKDYRNRQA